VKVEHLVGEILKQKGLENNEVLNSVKSEARKLSLAGIEVKQRLSVIGYIATFIVYVLVVFFENPASQYSLVGLANASLIFTLDLM
jgi:hypothetical protein